MQYLPHLARLWTATVNMVYQFLSRLPQFEYQANVFHLAKPVFDKISYSLIAMFWQHESLCKSCGSTDRS